MKGKELRERRQRLELTQEQLAAEFSVDRNTVARWERDERSIPPYLELALKTIERGGPGPEKPKPVQAKKTKTKPRPVPKGKK